MKKKQKKEVSIVSCPICLKNFISSIADKHVINCKKKKLKSSATVKHLERRDDILKIPQKATIHRPYLEKRSNSTQRLCESNVACGICGAIFPKSAKYCMMCGNIRFAN